jgi:hypothetical protein
MTRCFAGSSLTLGDFRILVDIQHAHTPKASPKFAHQRDVDVDVLKPPSLWLPLFPSGSHFPVASAAWISSARWNSSTALGLGRVGCGTFSGLGGSGLSSVTGRLTSYQLHCTRISPELFGITGNLPLPLGSKGGRAREQAELFRGYC